MNGEIGAKGEKENNFLCLFIYFERDSTSGSEAEREGERISQVGSALSPTQASTS